MARMEDRFQQKYTSTDVTTRHVLHSRVMFHCSDREEASYDWNVSFSPPPPPGFRSELIWNLLILNAEI